MINTAFFSSLIGILPAIFIILSYISFKSIRTNFFRLLVISCILSLFINLNYIFSYLDLSTKNYYICFIHGLFAQFIELTFIIYNICIAFHLIIISTSNKIETKDLIYMEVIYVIASPVISFFFSFVLSLLKSFGLAEEMFCWITHEFSVLRILFYYSFLWILFVLNTFLMIRTQLIGWSIDSKISILERSHATINILYPIIFFIVMIVPTINRTLETFLPTSLFLKEIHAAFGIRLFPWIILFSYSSTRYIQYPKDLKSIFSSLMSLNSFNSFLKKKMKSEYLFCYFQIERYKRMCEIELNNVKKKDDPSIISSKYEMAHLIFNRYLELDSVLEIRGNYTMIKEHLDSGDVNLFYPIQCKIMKEFDYLFIQYLKSKEYSTLEREIDQFQNDSQQILFFHLLSEFYQLWRRNMTIWKSIKEMFTTKKRKRNDYYEEIVDEEIIEKKKITKVEKTLLQEYEEFDEDSSILIKENEKLIKIKRGSFIEFVESKIEEYIKEKLDISHIFV
eukprot:gene10946-3652_t